MILDLYPYCLDIRGCGRSRFCVSLVFSLKVSVKDPAVYASFRLVMGIYAFLYSLDVHLYEFFCLFITIAQMLAIYTWRNGLVFLIHG